MVGWARRCACALLLSGVAACGGAGRSPDRQASWATGRAAGSEAAALSARARAWVPGLAAPEARARRRAALLLQARIAGDAGLAPADRACLAVVLRRRLRSETERPVAVALLQALGWAGDATDVRRLLAWCGGSGEEVPAALAALAVLADRLRLDPAAATLLLGPLRRPEAPVRRAAAWALTRLAQGADVGRSPAPCTRRACACRDASALLHSVTGPQSPAPAPRPQWPAAVMLALDRCSTSDPDARVRALCLRALAPTLDGQAGPWLLRRAEDPSVWVRLEAIHALARWGAGGAPRLAAALRALWQGVATSRQRLAGPELHPILVGLAALFPHAALAAVRQLADELLELADAARSSVAYAPPEARSIDLVHCLAAQLHDLAAAAVERTPTCGTAHDRQLDASWRRRQVVEVLSALARDAGWRLTLLRRYLVDATLAVRVAAVEALGTLGSAVVVPALRRAYADPSAAVFAAAARATTRSAALLEEHALIAPLAQGMLAHARPPPAAALCAGSEALAALRSAPPPRVLLQLALSAPEPIRSCARAALRALGAGELLGPGVAARVTGQHTAPRPTPARSVPASPRGAAPPPRRPRRLVLRTDRDEVVLELLWDEAPRAAAYLARLVRERSLEGALPYRVLPGELVELGRLPLDEHQDRLAEEHLAGAFERGSVGLVAAQGVATRALFIALQRQPQLDGRFPRVARVVAGLDRIERWRAGDRLQQISADADAGQGKAGGKP